MAYQIIFGIIGIGIGLLIIIYNRRLVDFFGRLGWMEEHLGPTGTYSFYKFLGIIVIILSTLILTGDLFKIIRGIANFIKSIMRIS